MYLSVSLERSSICDLRVQEFRVETRLPPMEAPWLGR